MRKILGTATAILLFASSVWAQAEGYPQSDNDAQIWRDRAQEKWNREHNVAPVVPSTPATAAATQPAIEPLSPPANEKTAPSHPASVKAGAKPSKHRHRKTYGHSNRSHHRHKTSVSKAHRQNKAPQP